MGLDTVAVCVTSAVFPAVTEVAAEEPLPTSAPEASRTELATVTAYGAQTIMVSSTLSPDLNDTVPGAGVGPFVLHNAAPGAVGDWSAGYRLDGFGF